MKQYSLVQVNFIQGPVSLNSYHLPYSTGLLAAYTASDSHVNKEWELRNLVWRREPIEQVAQSLKNDHVVGFSVYVWNREYSYTLARRVKELNPNCIIVMGGPEIPVTDPNIFQNFPWMDFVIRNEGELAWVEILKNYQSTQIDFPGVIINNNGTAVSTGEPVRITDINSIPSPYLSGVFDKIIELNPDVSWSCTLETNRGCPYACTFCDTGNAIYNKVKVFDLDRVLEEIEWMGTRCTYISVADANFGIFVDRDKIILDKFVEISKKYNIVDNFGITWAKNKKPEVYEMMRNFVTELPKSGQGLTLSVQDMDENVLKVIKRKNLDQHKLDSMFSWCRKNNIPFYTELIIGLPEQTVTSWKENFWKLFEAGNHNGVAMHHCEVIENAQMSLFQKSFYDIKTFDVIDYFGSSNDRDEIHEYKNTVISTNSISRDQMIELWTWDEFIATFHIYGISTYIARYIRTRYNISYSDFYENFYNFISDDKWMNTHMQTTRRLYNEWVDNGIVKHEINLPGWKLHYRMSTAIHFEKRLPQVYELLKTFLKVQYNITENVDQLIDFQQNCVLDHNLLQEYPIKKTFDLDFFGYINNDEELNKSATYVFDTTEDKNMNIETFVDNFWFARKRMFGSTIVQKIE